MEIPLNSLITLGKIENSQLIIKGVAYSDGEVIKDVEVSFDGYLPPDDSGDNNTFEYENKFKVSWKLTDNIRLYNLGEISKLKATQFYKGKIGIEYLF